MRILSFDTSTQSLHLSLFADGAPVVERSGSQTELEGPKGAERQQMATMLLPAVDECMREAGWAKDSLDCIVVGPGPGSFTGIRTAVVTARTLAQALRLPLIAVPLLETLASLCQLPAAVVLPAGRENFFVAAYEADNTATGSAPEGLELIAEVPILKPLAAPAYVSFDQLGSTLSVARLWAMDRSLADMMEVASDVELVELPKVKNIATRQAQIAWNRLSLRMSKAGGVGDPGGGAWRQSLAELFPFGAVQPLYLRSPSVTVKPSTQTQPYANENQADAPGRHR